MDKKKIFLTYHNLGPMTNDFNDLKMMNDTLRSLKLKKINFGGTNLNPLFDKPKIDRLEQKLLLELFLTCMDLIYLTQKVLQNIFL